MATPLKFNHDEENFLRAIGADDEAPTKMAEKFVEYVRESKSYSRILEKIYAENDGKLTIESVMQIMLLGHIFGLEKDKPVGMHALIPLLLPLLMGSGVNDKDKN